MIDTRFRRKSSQPWNSAAMEEYMEAIDDLDKIGFTDMKVVLGRWKSGCNRLKQPNADFWANV